MSIPTSHRGLLTFTYTEWFDLSTRRPVDYSGATLREQIKIKREMDEEDKSACSNQKCHLLCLSRIPQFAAEKDRIPFRPSRND
jgi:hypothetical protein